MSAMTAKSFDWSWKNKAKNSSKLTKLCSICYFFQFSKKCSYGSSELLYSHSTPYYGPICPNSSNSYNWDLSESKGKKPKPTPLPHMRLCNLDDRLVAVVFSYNSQGFDI